MNGSQIRLSHLMEAKDSKSYIVAADHAFLMGPSTGTFNLAETLDQVLLGSPDAILLSKGRAKLIAHIFHNPGSPALIIRADWFSGPRLFSPHLPLSRMDKFLACSAEEALSLGAEAMMVYCLASFSSEFDSLCYAQAAAAIRNCESYGLPLIAEPLPGNPFMEDEDKNQVIIESARILENLGAAALKVPYVNEDGLRRLVKAVKIPIWVLGGDLDSEEAVYQKAALQMAAGASGIVYGRNVIQAAKPAEVSRNLYNIVHEKS